MKLLAAMAFLPAAQAAGADCNGNGITDIEEVRSGAHPDCNLNGVPDPCDIAPVNYGLVSAGSFFVGHSPLEVILDDIDGDGDMDIASSSTAGTEDVTILLNDGKGRLAPPIRWPVGQAADFLGVADFDRDGLKDLAVTGRLGVTVLFQDQQRRFFSRDSVLILEQRVHGLALGDLDADLDTDLVAVVPFGVRILRNEGAGIFSPLDRMTMGSAPVKVFASTLDGDEDLDLATCNITGGDAGNVSIFINRGDGSFELPRNYATARDPSTLVTGDMDGDGDADLATANQDMISLLLGDGQGRFTLSNELKSERILFSLASGDLDGDGYIDLASAGGQRVDPAGVDVFLNRGGTEFAHLVDFDTESFTTDIRSSDMDGDGTLDLILGDIDLAAVTILQRSKVAYSTDCNSNLRPDDCELEGNDCNGNEFPDECDMLSGASTDCNRNGAPDECDIPGSGFGFETTFLRTRSFASLTSASDLDADGRDDIYAVAEPGDFLVFWNGGPEGFLPEVRFPAGLEVTDSATGDLDGDADRDIVFADLRAQALRILENRGSRSFEGGRKISLPVPNRVSTADLDGDLDFDLAATTFAGNLVVFENRGGATFGDRLPVAGEVSEHILAVADLDGDGRPDLAAASHHQGSLFLFWNGGSLAFQGPTSIEPLFAIQAVGITDAEDDGDEDIFLSADRLVLFRNSGGRTFAREELSSDPIGGVSGILPGDLDRDGTEDLAIVSGFQLAALLNRGGGAFGPPVEIAWFPPNGFPTLPATGDWNGDGALDLVLISDFTIRIFENVSKPPVSRDADANGIPDECQPRPFHRADANGDGEVNLTDPVFTLRHLFQGDSAPTCLEAADTNNDAQLGITDPIATLDFLFRSGPPPAPPGPPPASCGFDTDASGSLGDIGCGAYGGCGV